MNCPECELVLRLAEPHGEKIDYCCKCSGVRPDRCKIDNRNMNESAG